MDLVTKSHEILSADLQILNKWSATQVEVLCDICLNFLLNASKAADFEEKISALTVTHK